MVFLNNLTSFEDQLNRRGEFIKEIKKQLYEVQHERRFRVKFEVQSSWWPNARSLSFKLSAPHLHQEVEFDVLPAFDVLGKPACQRASAHKRNHAVDFLAVVCILMLILFPQEGLPRHRVDHVLR